ncbi:MAG TPA: 5-(carboxyamino)imidazole ribonucleotide mutase [Nitrospiria bacterium]|nr:5-(carboxyamino)imidazole ribonucleotide mutase [Nitrospiria bacterium]
MRKPLVSIVMGSESDLTVMEQAAEVLGNFGVAHELAITSAHRSPDWTRRYISEAEKKGVEIFIAGAGGAAHLAGTVAAHTTRPVIGVPIDSSSLNGLDALLSTAQMPGGVPVATMAIGKAGAKNAGILAVQILGVGDKELARKIKNYKDKLEEEVEAKARRIQRAGRQN